MQCRAARWGAVHIRPIDAASSRKLRSRCNAEHFHYGRLVRHAPADDGEGENQNEDFRCRYPLFALVAAAWNRDRLGYGGHSPRRAPQARRAALDGSAASTDVVPVFVLAFLR